MPTTNPRVNLVLDPQLHDALRRLATRRGVSVARAARDLVVEAMSLEEDARLAAVAAERRRTLQGTQPLSHEQVWGG